MSRADRWVNLLVSTLAYYCSSWSSEALWVRWECPGQYSLIDSHTNTVFAGSPGHRTLSRRLFRFCSLKDQVPGFDDIAWILELGAQWVRCPLESNWPHSPGHVLGLFSASCRGNSYGLYPRLLLCKNIRQGKLALLGIFASPGHRMKSDSKVGSGPSPG